MSYGLSDEDYGLSNEGYGLSDESYGLSDGNYVRIDGNYGISEVGFCFFVIHYSTIVEGYDQI
jgi:hypothetical protein